MIYVIGGIESKIAKSTTAANLAIYLSMQKQHEVLLIDADQSQCSTDFLSSRKKHTPDCHLRLMQLSGQAIKQEVIKNQSEYDDIVIDCGIGENLKYAMEVSSRLIVPLSDKELHLWGFIWNLTRIEDLIRESLKENKSLVAYAFLISKSTQEKDDAYVIKSLEESQFVKFVDNPLLDDPTLLKQTFLGQTISKGYSAFDYKPVNEKATAGLTKIFETTSA
jgi:cellulose biosynthesis protein BcsQ